jgi:hypothetical protein
LVVASNDLLTHCFFLYYCKSTDWIGRVGKAIVRCSSTYYSQNGGGGQQQQQRSNTNNPNSPYRQQQQQYQDDDSDDSDILYEDPNNPNPYFND